MNYRIYKQDANEFVQHENISVTPTGKIFENGKELPKTCVIQPYIGTLNGEPIYVGDAVSVMHRQDGYVNLAVETIIQNCNPFDFDELVVEFYYNGINPYGIVFFRREGKFLTNREVTMKVDLPVDISSAFVVHWDMGTLSNLLYGSKEAKIVYNITDTNTWSVLI